MKRASGNGTDGLVGQAVDLPTDGQTRPRVGIRDVALCAGVSTATVSRALSNHPRVAPATRIRIIATAEVLGYIPSAAAAALATGRTGNIGVLTPSLRHGHFIDALEGAFAALAHTSYGLCLFVADEDACWRAALKNAAGRIDALLVLEPELAAEVPKGLITRSVTTQSRRTTGQLAGTDLGNQSATLPGQDAKHQVEQAVHQMLATIEAVRRVSARHRDPPNHFKE